jgi:hypothetical protein
MTRPHGVGPRGSAQLFQKRSKVDPFSGGRSSPSIIASVACADDMVWLLFSGSLLFGRPLPWDGAAWCWQSVSPQLPSTSVVADVSPSLGDVASVGYQVGNSLLFP